MLAVLKRIVRKDLVRVFSLTAMSTMVRMIAGFVSVKIISGLIGPSGIALVGQLTNFSSIVLTISTGGINSGVTKYISENPGSRTHTSQILSTAFCIAAVMSLLAGVVIITGSGYFSRIILHDTRYSPVITIFGFTIIFYAFNALLLSAINGYKEFNKYVVVNIISSLVGLTFSASLAYFYGVYGALLSAITFESVVFLITLYIAVRSPWFRSWKFRSNFSFPALRKLSNFSLMAVVSAATVPVAQIIIRNTIIREASLNDAGLWDGMNKISTMYLLIITTSLGIYYLPRLSELKNPLALRSEILSTYKIILPPLLLLSLGLYFSRDLIIVTLFNPAFHEMNRLFAFQLAGDFLKICSWILSFQMLAKSMTKLYVVTEIAGCILYVTLATVSIRFLGNVGATIGYAACYLVYFISLLIIFRKLIFYRYAAKQRKPAERVP